jgi:hypothetical protein
MEAEHTRMAGCDMRFTSRNYGITTTATAEWGVVMRGQMPPPEHMLHNRIMVPVEEKLRWINEQFAKKGLKMRLRREEVIAVTLYTGPMYMIYNCVLAPWSNPAAMLGHASKRQQPVHDNAQRACVCGAEAEHDHRHPRRAEAVQGHGRACVPSGALLEAGRFQLPRYDRLGLHELLG